MNTNRRYDYKQLFDAYMQTNSYPQAAKMLAEKGIVGKKGLPIGLITYRYCMMKYRLEEPEYTRQEMIKNGWYEYKVKEFWEERLIQDARQVYASGTKPSIKRFVAILYKLDLYEKAIAWGYIRDDFVATAILNRDRKPIVL